jgi:hypothetical protein
MKRFLIMFFVFLAASGQIVHSQPMQVIDVAVADLTTKLGWEQYIYYGQQLADNALQITHLVSQVEYTAKTYEQAFNNLSRIGEIKNYDDFWDWYNRQLYLERTAMETFGRMNVSIGSKQYSLTDIEGIARGLDESYVQYWNDEFTEEQRREMWIGLGLTPANYAYRETFREKEHALARKFLALSEIQNREYMDQVSRGNEIKEHLAADVFRPQEDKIGEKELSALQLEMLVNMNKTLNDLSMMTAAELEYLGIDYYKKQEPVYSPVLSVWPQDGFGKLK